MTAEGSSEQRNTQSKFISMTNIMPITLSPIQVVLAQKHP